MAVLTKRTLADLAWIPALAVAALQMNHINAGLLTSQGADFFCPMALYAATRTNGTIARRFIKTTPTPFVSAAIVLVLCLTWELCQLRDFSGTPLVITRGTFDPLDIAAYVLGVALALAIELLWRRRTGEVAPAKGATS